MTDITKNLRERVATAYAEGTPLRIRGGGSKPFYGRPCDGEPLEVAGHAGIVSYDPRELVISARAGTPLTELEAAVAEGGQMLPFEPPHLGPGATLGGTIACGLSGPRRPYAGSTRDFVLGSRVINGKGELLRLGGEVIKNVAGYDVSRVMVGALGTLGVVLEVSLKVLPRPTREVTLTHECTAEDAIARMQGWAGRPLPLSAAAYRDGALRLRLSGSERAVAAATESIGGEPEDGAFWNDLKEQRLPFFAGDTPLWRLAVAPDTPPMALPGEWLIDWGGAQRWLRSSAEPDEVRAAAAAAGGHATLFRGGERGAVFHPLSDTLFKLHRNLKGAFDPRGILNPGCLYPGL